MIFLGYKNVIKAEDFFTSSYVIYVDTTERNHKSFIDFKMRSKFLM